MLILFKQDDLNLKHVYDDQVTTDMDFKMLKQLCANCWKNKFGFLVIVKECDLNKGRYRLGFVKYINIE